MKLLKSTFLGSLLLSVPALGADVPSETIDVTGVASKPKKPDLGLEVIPYSLNTLDFNFPSGLRILMQPDHSQPMVAVTSVIDRGSSSDPVGKEGIAHFVEHLWFKSLHGDLPKVWDMLSEMGCDLNASTALDWTNYMSSCPKNALPALMKFESLRLTDTVRRVVQEDIDPEREVVRNELRMRYEQGGGEFLRYVLGNLYPEGHPYHRLGIGSHGSLDNIQLEDIQQFTKDHYRPENTTIVIVGDFNPEEASSLIFQHFDLSLLHPDLTEEHLRRAPKPGIDDPDPDDPDHWLYVAMDPKNTEQPLELVELRPRLTDEREDPPPPHNTEPLMYEAPQKEDLVAVAWSLPPAWGEDQIVMNLTMNVAGNIANGILREDYRTAKDTYGNVASCFAWPGKVSSTGICTVQVKDVERYGEAIADRLIDQMATLWNPELVSAVELSLSRSRQQQMASIFVSLDKFSGIGQGTRATDIAMYAHFTGNARYHSEMINLTNSMKGMEIGKYANKYLQRDRAAITLLKPLPEDELVKDSSESDYHAAGGDSDVLKMILDADEVDAELLAEELTLPEMDKLKTFKLPNGLEVVIMPHGEAPVAWAMLWFYGGYATGPRALDDMAWRYKTLPKNDPLQFAGTIQEVQESNKSISGIIGSAGNLDGILWMLRDNIEEMRVDLSGRTTWIKDQKKRVKESWTTRAYWYGHERDRLINKGHPFTTPRDIGYYDAAASYSSSDLRKYQQRKFQPANSILIIVGRVDADEAQKLAVETFGGWAAPSGVEIGRVDSPPPQGPSQPGEILLFEKADVTQSNVQLFCPLQPANAENFATTRVLRTVLREKLFTRLREQSGVTYSPSASVLSLEGGTNVLAISSLVQNNAVSLTIDILNEVVSDTKSLSNEQLAKVKLNEARKYVLRQQAVQDMADRLYGPANWRSDWSFITDYPKRLAQIDAPAIASMLEGCEGQASVFIEGPTDIVGPQLDEAGVAYTIVDWKAKGEELLKTKDKKAYKKYMKAKAKADKKREEEGEDN